MSEASACSSVLGRAGVQALTIPSCCDACAFHSRMLVSSLPDSTYEPSPLKRTQNTLPGTEKTRADESGAGEGKGV